MIHGYDRLTGKVSLSKESEPFDYEASKIYWKWVNK